MPIRTYWMDLRSACLLWTKGELSASVLEGAIWAIPAAMRAKIQMSVLSDLIGEGVVSDSDLSDLVRFFAEMPPVRGLAQS